MVASSKISVLVPSRTQTTSSSRTRQQINFAVVMNAPASIGTGDPSAVLGRVYEHKHHLKPRLSIKTALG